MYTEFAQIYDEVMDHVPYDEWASFLLKKLFHYNPNLETINELACGTGNLTFHLNQFFKVKASDISEEMIEIAKNKFPDIFFYKENMIDMSENIVNFDAVVCMYDSLNYLSTTKDLELFFKSASKRLNEDGILIFDIITMEKIKNLFNNGVFIYENRNFYYIWYNKFITKNIFINDLIFFVRQKNGMFRKIHEKHKRRIFENSEIMKAAEKYGFYLLEKTDGFHNKKSKDDSERIVYFFRGGKI